MSFLSDIFTYWQGNSTLNAAIPFNKVWTGLVPANTAFPYVVIVSVSSEPTFLTGKSYFEDYTFQVSVFDTDLDNVESLAQTIMDQFDWQPISAAPNISCMRENYQVFIDPDTPKTVYHAMIQYALTKNRVLP